MNWNIWFRQMHRWLSVAFTVVVLINGGAAVAGKYNASWAFGQWPCCYCCF